MSMAHHGSSLLRSIGNVLHMPPNPYSLPNNVNGTCNQDPTIKVFEECLATRLNSLIPPEESQTLSLEWLKKAVQVSTETNLDAQTFIPEVQLPLSDRDEKWITKYLDGSLNILYMCNKMREGVAGIEKILMLVKLILHLLNLQGYSDKIQLGRIKDAICECLTALESWSETTRAGLKGNHKSDHYLIEDMPKMLLSAKSEHAMRKQAFLTVLYAAKLTTTVICSFVVTAFTGRRDLLAELPVPEFFAWSSPMLSLQETVKAVTIKRTAKGLNFFIPELSNLEFCLTKLKALVDGYGNDVVFTYEEELKEKASNLVSDLKYQSEALEKSLEFLEGEFDRLFYLTIANRKSVLDKLKG